MKKRTIPEAGKADWTATGSFMFKPKQGWLHSDEDIARGITFRAVYVGCVKLLKSVKPLSIEDRSVAIREGIARCCDKVGFVKRKKKPLPQSLSDAFGDAFTGYGGEQILITISKSSVKIVLETTGVVICEHHIENISFASGGEKKYNLYVSYIAKDSVFERACFVIQCSKDNRSEVIQSLGHAFEAKYKDFMRKPIVAAEVPEKFSEPIFPEADNVPQSLPGYASLRQDDNLNPNGYSKLHGLTVNDSDPYSKLDRGGRTSSVGSAASNEYGRLQHGAVAQEGDPGYDRIQAGREFCKNRPASLPFVAGADYDKLPATNDFAAVYDNPMASPSAQDVMLIDFNDNSPTYATVNQTPEVTYEDPEKHRPQKQPSPYDNPKDLMKTHEYQQQLNVAANGTHWEKFDEAPQPPGPSENVDGRGYCVPVRIPQRSGKYASLHHDSEDSAEYQSPEDIADYQHPKPTEYNPPDTHYQTPKSAAAGRPKSFVGPLANKQWFHGHISRGDAESLIEKDGQFLVRESSSSVGQYVLSGMKDGQHRHLLLVDPEGQVRTKDRAFASVEELIRYHQTNNLPIISGGSDVHILDAVCRKPQGNNNRNVIKDGSFKI